jgi:hypothetical protein
LGFSCSTFDRFFQWHPYFRTQISQDTGITAGFASLADLPPVQDEAMAERRPFGRGQQLHQGLFNLVGVRVARQAEPS